MTKHDKLKVLIDSFWEKASEVNEIESEIYALFKDFSAEELNAKELSNPGLWRFRECFSLEDTPHSYWFKKNEDFE